MFHSLTSGGRQSGAGQVSVWDGLVLQSARAPEAAVCQQKLSHSVPPLLGTWARSLQRPPEAAFAVPEGTAV